jgi:hypothetical protein
MFEQDVKKINRKFQFACLILCSLYNGFALWQECGFSPFGLIRAVTPTTHEITISWLMLPFCLFVSLISTFFVYVLFRKTNLWGKLLLVLLVGFNLTYLILSTISFSFFVTYAERYFAEPKIFAVVVLIVNLVSAIPMLVIWLLSAVICKFFTPKTLR